MRLVTHTHANSRQAARLDRANGGAVF